MLSRAIGKVVFCSVSLIFTAGICCAQGKSENKPAAMSTAVIRQQMGHSSHRVTALYSGEIPLDQVSAAFSSKLLEKMEKKAAA